jgi:hypothetical protein
MTDIGRHLPEIAVAAALAWGSGLRVYAVLLAVGLAGHFGWIDLPQHLAILSHPLAMAASGLMACAEFFADKIPWLDSLWDAVHGFIRIPAGAALAAAVFADSGAATALAAAILGGSLSAGTHLAKAGARAALNTSPEPLSNWLASFSEDGLVPLGLWLAFVHPLAFLVLLLLFLLAAALLARAILRALRTLYSKGFTRSPPTGP